MITVRATNQNTGEVKIYKYSYGNKNVIINKCKISSEKNNITYVIWEFEHQKTLVYKGKSKQV